MGKAVRCECRCRRVVFGGKVLHIENIVKFWK